MSSQSGIDSVVWLLVIILCRFIKYNKIRKKNTQLEKRNTRKYNGAKSCAQRDKIKESLMLNGIQGMVTLE